jgi:hypothetical protein
MDALKIILAPAWLACILAAMGITVRTVWKLARARTSAESLDASDNQLIAFGLALIACILAALAR